MTTRRRAAKVTVVALCLSAALDAHAETPTARGEFERGVTLAREGKLEAAVMAFESAYRLRPHYSVLFNLGQARAAMGQSVEAVDAFKRYLVEGGTALDDARRKQVKELVSFHEKRIGLVRLDIEPDGAEVWLDGRLIGTSPLSEPVKVTVGAHGIAVRKAGFSPMSETIQVHADSATPLAFRASLAQAEVAQGVLSLRCAVPDVEVSVDDRPIGQTPATGSFVAPIGSRTIRFARSGYLPDEQTVEVLADRPAEVVCRPRRSNAGPRGALKVRAEPVDALVWLDGERFGGESLPVGRHLLRVERAGYRPSTRFVVIQPSNTAHVAVTLRPTEAQVAAWRAEQKEKRTWAIGLTIGGVVLAGTAAATYVWNSGRHDDWKKDRLALDQELAEGPATADALEENEALTRRATSIRNVDLAALTMGIAGGLSLAASGALWLDLSTGPDASNTMETHGNGR